MVSITVLRLSFVFILFFLSFNCLLSDEPVLSISLSVISVSHIDITPYTCVACAQMVLYGQILRNSY